ncbi:hypothetical protein [Streptomyces sp. NPDC005476]|uniref:hypothetical protein n=1 Tax=Streptomyces sp. NPDC005476 TaxID=3156882 RepID=UPI0034542D8F
MASVELGDPAALRALAQLRRQHMLEHLSLHDPATWATLARALGRNTGSTSSHLREPAGRLRRGHPAGRAYPPHPLLAFPAALPDLIPSVGDG